jgi:hypothetical protein
MRPIFIAILSVLFFVTLCLAQQQNVYYNQEGHFSFDIPQGWEEFSKDAMDEMSKGMNQVKGPKIEMGTGFYDTGETGAYMMLKVAQVGKMSEEELQTLISDGGLAKITQDTEKKYGDSADTKFDEMTYDKEKHILYMNVGMSSGGEKVLGTIATVLSNDGSVTMAFYASEENFDAASEYFKQIIDSLNFDPGYGYSDLQ